MDHDWNKIEFAFSYTGRSETEQKPWRRESYTRIGPMFWMYEQRNNKCTQCECGGARWTEYPIHMKFLKMIASTALMAPNPISSGPSVTRYDTLHELLVHLAYGSVAPRAIVTQNQSTETQEVEAEIGTSQAAQGMHYMHRCHSAINSDLSEQQLWFPMHDANHIPRPPRFCQPHILRLVEIVCES